MIGQKRLLKKEFPQFVILIGKAGSGKKTLVREKFDNLVEGFSKVDDVRWIIEDSRDLVDMRTYLLDGNEMTYQAQNALLKITEEPNEKTRIILTGRFQKQFLNTLLSRATIFHMDTYSKEELMNFTDKPELIGIYGTPGLLVQYDEELVYMVEKLAHSIKSGTISQMFEGIDSISEFCSIYGVKSPIVMKTLKWQFRKNPEAIRLISKSEYYAIKNFNFIFEELVIKIRGVVG